MTARILVVDDIPNSVKLLEARLLAEYFDAITANNGRQVLEICGQDRIDLVLLDVMMPGMDGFEVCRRLKADKATMHIPVIMVTALDQPSDRVRGLRAGADDFLTKPVNNQQLMARVKSLVRLRAMTDELRIRAEAADDIDLSRLLEGGALSGRKGKTLFVDERRHSRARIAQILAGSAEVTAVGGPEAALLEVDREDFELLLVSSNFANHDPLRLCSQFRSLDKTRFVPILLICNIGEELLVNRALELGVNDYIVHPLDRNELIARCNTQFRYKRYDDYLRSSVQQTIELVVADPLTGLYNRRYLDRHLRPLIERSIERGQAMSVLMIDLDRFKAVNDTYGHDAGDDILRQFAKRIRATVRSIDLACRQGGEEFVVVLPDADRAIAERVAERVRRHVAEIPFVIGENRQKLSVTASIGSTTLCGPEETPASLLKRADVALYKAKKSGRNRVVAEAA